MVGVKTGTVVEVLVLIATPFTVAVGVTNPSPGVPLAGGGVVVVGVGVSGIGEMMLFELLVELPDIIDATAGEERAIGKETGTLIVISAESLSVVPFVETIVTVNIHDAPEAFA